MFHDHDKMSDRESGIKIRMAVYGIVSDRPMQYPVHFLSTTLAHHTYNVCYSKVNRRNLIKLI